MSRKVKAAVLGAGWYAAQSHIPALRARSEVVLDGVSRLGADDLARVRAHFGFAFASEDFHAVLARRPDIVVVASPHHLHAPMARAALESGAQVLCEKPMTLDPAEAWDLVATADRLGRHLLVATGYQYLPQVAELRDRLMSGAIGEIENISVTFFSATRAVFEGDVGLERWTRTFFRPDRSTWQDPAQGGGFAYGQMSHSLSLLYFLTGLQPVSVSAHHLTRNGVDLANAAAIQLAGGAIATVSGSAALPEGNRALLRMFFAGSKGVLVAEFDRDFAEIRLRDGSAERLPIAAGDWEYNCIGPIDALVDLALGCGENRSPGAIGAATTATIAAMLSSNSQGGASVDIMRPRAVS